MCFHLFPYFITNQIYNLPYITQIQYTYQSKRRKMFTSQNSDRFQKQILSKIINQKSHLNKIHQKQPPIFAEIIKVFGINQSKQSHESLYKLKQRLINICIQQKQDFLEYLSLPKFKQISQHALELLKISMEQIKQLVKSQQQRMKSDFIFSSLSKLIPQYHSINDLENYHLQIFQLYSKSSICPNFFQPQFNGENFNGKEKTGYEKNINPFQNSIHSNFVKSQPQDIRQNNSNSQGNFDYKRNVFRKSSKDYHKSQQIIDQPNHMKNYCFQSNSSPLFRKPSKTSKRSSSQLIEDYQPSSGHKMQKVDQSAKILQDFSQPLSNFSESKHRTFEVVDPNFKNCLCKGKIQKVGQQQFSCENCMKKFHFQCLRLSSEKQRQDRKKCPICSVQEMRSYFFEVIKPPLMSSWIVFSKENNVPFEIKFNQKLLGQMKNIYRKQNSSVYLKMITILRRSQINNGTQNGKQRTELIKKPQNVNKEQTQNNESESQVIEYQQVQQNSHNNNLQNKPNSEHKQKQTSIELPERYIHEISRSQSSGLQLNFGYSPEYLDRNNNKFYEQERLIYFGIYQVRKRTVEQVIDSYRSLFRDQIKGIDQQGRLNQKTIINLIRMFQDQNRTINKSTFVQQIPIRLDKVLNKDLNKREIFPLRFYKCQQLSHVFELQDLLKGFQKDKDNNIGLNRSNPQLQLRYCPKCINKGLSIQQLQNMETIKDSQKFVYVDYELHKLLNNQKINQNIESSGQTLVNMNVFVTKQMQAQTEISYAYSFKTQNNIQNTLIQEQKAVLQENHVNHNEVIERQVQMDKQVQQNKQIQYKQEQQNPNEQSYSIQESHQSIDYQS